MPAMNDPKAVKKQYATADGLNARIGLHQKYSVNPVPYDDWIASYYHIQPGERVLELGCGTAGIWRQAERYLPKEASLILTDLSSGMLEEARKNVPEMKNITFAQVDIQQIPWPDVSFDVVIANMMLYHVPDLDRALAEAARILKPGGRFLCSTSGEKNVGNWLVDALGEGDSRKLSFTLQNGTEILHRHFRSVERFEREDALCITRVEDLAAYVLSITSFSYVRSWPHERLMELLAAKMEDGVILIPKENGMFQCREPIVTKIFD